jgi:glutamate-ammonia-ligase adenylyltransferase
MNRATLRSEVLRLGFADADRALEELAELGDAGRELLAILGRSAEPSAALSALVRLADAVDDRDRLLTTLAADEGTAMRLLSVLGASAALADHLASHPEHWEVLTDPTLGSTRPAAWTFRAALMEAVGADPGAPEPVATVPEAEAVNALRVTYRRLLLPIAARDLAHDLGVDDAAAELADLAAGTLDAALAVARAHVGEESARVRLAVIAMGKCGGHELNYVSDVDVIFVHEPVASDEDADDGAAARIAARLASRLMQVCSDHTAEGTIWPVDAALRPEGKAGALSRTIAGHRGYYERWAAQWEFQALLKARPVAGDIELGREFVDMVSPMVWSAADREGFVDAARAMRRRVLDHIPAKEADRQLKLGVGGLRDVEFAVQLLQLVHGRADEQIRLPTTLSALSSLTKAGYVGRRDGEALHTAYAFLRQLEHRIQLHRLRRTHLLPDDEASLRRLGRSLGFMKEPDKRLVQTWEHHRREVSRLHQKLFYRPLLSAVARIPGDDVRLSSEAAEARLAALGYDDPAAALRNLEALTAGVTRTANIQRTLLPAMLQWFADGADPDAGLFGFRRISEALGRTPWYLTTLRDEGEVAQRLAHLLATSRYCSDLLEREPQGIKLLGTDLTPRPSDVLTDEMLATAGRQEDPDKAVRAIRAVRRRELLRIAAGDVLGLIDVADVGNGLSRITDATLEATLAVVGEGARVQRGLDAAPTRIAVVAMGRYGGFELSSGSDADVLFVHEPEEGVDQHEAASYAKAVAEELRRTLALPGSDPPLVVDADLRPEGKNGPLVRTLDSYAAYYAKWSKVWEAQALLRADAVVGDLGVRERFTALIDPLRYPPSGLTEDDIIEVRRIKARVDNERLPRGADPAVHFKLGRGGLADIEWTVQLLQLRYGAEVPGLRTAQTLAALAAATEAGLLTSDDADVLSEGWRAVSRVRNAATLARGKPADQMPRPSRERRAVAGILGYQLDQSDAMVNDYLRVTRRARAVVDRVFWE